MYKPREDSLMLAEQVKKLARGKVLDIGTGTGVQAAAAAGSSKVNSVLAVDVDEDSINYCKKSIKNSKINFAVSDLFSNVSGKFDTIIFNPPYLPQDKEIKDKALYGGKKGWEIIEKFFKQIKKHLNKDGIILIVFSSLTGKKKVDEIIAWAGFSFKQVAKHHFFFEELYVYAGKENSDIHVGDQNFFPA